MTLWTGLSVEDSSTHDLETAEQFFRGPYQAALDRTLPAGAERRSYELFSEGGRGPRAPRFLTILAFPTAGDAQRASDGGGDPALPEPWATTVSTAWSAIYERVAETAPQSEVPFGMYLVGVNPPAGLSPAELDEFNDFYTNVHLPEVAARRHCLRAVRFELRRQLARGDRRCPRFLAAYEVDERAAATTRHIGGPYAKGPDVWQRHATPWRQWYRQLRD